MSEFPAYISDGFEDTEVREYPVSVVSGEELLVGDLALYVVATNLLTRCAADPAIIAGISEVVSEKARLLTPNAKIPFRVIKGPKATLALSSATVPTQAHVGDQYGITRSAGGRWQLDVAKVAGDARVLVKEVDIPNGIFFCQVLNDQLQFATIA